MLVFWTEAPLQAHFQKLNSETFCWPSASFTTQILKIHIAYRDNVPVRKQVGLRFHIAADAFEETFMVLPKIGSILIGVIFLEKYSRTLDIIKNVLRFPDLSLQIKHANGKYKCKMCKVRATRKKV